MASIIQASFGQGGSLLTGERGDANSLRNILVDLVADIATIRQAIIDEAAYADARATITAAAVQVTVAT